MLKGGFPGRVREQGLWALSPGSAMYGPGSSTSEPQFPHLGMEIMTAPT